MEIPKFARGGIVTFSEMGCEMLDVVPVVRHRGRKWKKRNGLLRRQRRRVVKVIRKSFAKFHRATYGSSPIISIDGRRVGEVRDE